jgi:hypothetical protein
MGEFIETLRTQRFDDHRFYHQSRINQSLHLVSAISFLVAYAMLITDPAMAAIIGWCFSMGTRQAGHFFFEPRGFDTVNGVTDEYKERVKVGYNMARKVVLLSACAGVPLLLGLSPSLFGLITPATDWRGTVHDIGIAWLALAVAGLAFRVVQLWVRDDAVQALAWLTKILTDPVWDIVQYWKAPLALLRGERLDPMAEIRRG